MEKEKRIHYFEIIIYLFTAFSVLFAPMFIHLQEERGWSFILEEWLRLTPFFIIFLINNFLLIPKLLFKSKYSSYIIASFLTLMILAFASPYLPHFFSQKHKIEIPKPPPHLELKQRHHSPPYKPVLDFRILTLGLLLIGFNSGIKIFIRRIEEQEKYNERERHYLSTELAFLKHQISPHFFMNTLNNIHALVDIDLEKAKNAIIKLSRLMRYILYESNSEKILLTKEIKFFESYIELMQLRYNTNNLTIHLSFPEIKEPVYIPALLTLPLIENAFKHGVRVNKKSFIDILFKIENKQLILIIKNSNFPKTFSKFNNTSGIGLGNIRKRLKLIYQKNYSIKISQLKETFQVTLTIPIE
jgi:hypothetical protein